MTNELDRLYDVANDHEVVVLDDLRQRAGLTWTCADRHAADQPAHWTNPTPFPCEICGREMYGDIEGLEDWTGPQCLRWLAKNTTAPNYFLYRAEDWDSEVERFATYEGRDRDEWEADALDDLRHEIRVQRDRIGGERA